ncbi:alpha/beta fold hydrolase [Nibricoccus sp. IMCC34717]|uniref:alpha/beta fold hydrolase n=1 Tax=Nibricoccus sp. IMCC34717 TaxID=3034021 RepID=UPI00384E7741
MANETWRDLYPFAPKTHQTPGGARMSYLDEGPRERRAVLCVHGNPTWSFYYRNVALGLREQRRVIVPDHVGMGLSEKPQHYTYTLKQRIEDLLSLVEACGVEELDLVVHDWGGAIGFGFANRFAGVIRRIVILNTGAFFLPRIPARIALCRAPVVGPLLVRGLNGFAWPATFMCTHTRALTCAEKQGYLHPHGNWADRVAVDGFVRDIPMEREHPTRPVLAEVAGSLSRWRDNPKLILWGGKDFCFNDDFLRRWTEVFPNAAVTRYAEAGHYVLEDTDGEAVRRVGEFLRA